MRMVQVFDRFMTLVGLAVFFFGALVILYSAWASGVYEDYTAHLAALTGAILMCAGVLVVSHFDKD